MAVPQPKFGEGSKNPNHNHFYSEALINSPLEDLFGSPDHNQHDMFCRDFEYHLALCVKAYGFYKGQVKCDQLVKDLHECLMGDKQNSRHEIMTGEFVRQMKAGERKYEETKFIPFF